MKSFADAILGAEAVSKAPKGSITAPKKVRAEALTGLDADAKRLVWETFNPYRVYGTKKWDEPRAYANTDPALKYFIELLDLLASKTLTGNAARSAISAVMGRYTKRTAAVLTRVIKKDLKCGADRSTFEDIYTDLGIPSFELALAASIENTKQNPYKNYPFVFPYLAETKYDGNRLLAMVDGVVEYLTRSGKPSDFCDGIFDAELLALEKLVGEPIVVDGEALGNGYLDTQRAKGSDGDKSNLRFFVFDWMTLAQWKARNCPVKQIARSKSLEAAINKLGLKLVIKSAYRIVNNLAEVENYYNEVVEQGLPGQEEGLILKDMDGYYIWDRSQNWLKLKPVIHVDLKVTGFYIGQKNTKNADKLGGFNVEGYDENKNHIKSNCGGMKVNSKEFKGWFEAWAKANGINIKGVQGFAPKGTQAISKDQFFRKFVWDNQDMFLGTTIEIEAGSLSLAQNSATYSLRFPRFLRVRDDK